MQRQSYQVKTVLEKKGARKKTFLAFKDSLGNPLSRSPIVSYGQLFQFLLLPILNLVPSRYRRLVALILLHRVRRTFPFLKGSREAYFPPGRLFPHRMHETLVRVSRAYIAGLINSRPRYLHAPRRVGRRTGVMGVRKETCGAPSVSQQLKSAKGRAKRRELRAHLSRVARTQAGDRGRPSPKVSIGQSSVDLSVVEVAVITTAVFGRGEGVMGAYEGARIENGGGGGGGGGGGAL